MTAPERTPRRILVVDDVQRGLGLDLGPRTRLTVSTETSHEQPLGRKGKQRLCQRGPGSRDRKIHEMSGEKSVPPHALQEKGRVRCERPWFQERGARPVLSPGWALRDPRLEDATLRGKDRLRNIFQQELNLSFFTPKGLTPLAGGRGAATLGLHHWIISLDLRRARKRVALRRSRRPWTLFSARFASARLSAAFDSPLTVCHRSQRKPMDERQGERELAWAMQRGKCTHDHHEENHPSHDEERTAQASEAHHALGDKALFDRYLLRYPPAVSELTFTNAFCWAEIRHHLFRECEGHLLVCYRQKDCCLSFYPPVGPEPVALLVRPIEGLRDYHALDAPSTRPWPPVWARPHGWYWTGTTATTCTASRICASFGAKTITVRGTSRGGSPSCTTPRSGRSPRRSSHQSAFHDPGALAGGPAEQRVGSG